jgi:transcriptional regulatory protein PHF12/RCO1
MGRLPRKERAPATMARPLRLLTWNIRYDWMTPRPSTSKETPWPARRSSLCALLQHNASTHGIIALQEVLHHQLLDLHSLLNSGEGHEWEWIGVGRDDGRKAGEYSPVFYNRKRHELVSWRTFWLSESPERPGRGWDAACVRICTVGRFSFLEQPGQHAFTIMVPSLSSVG